VVKAKGPRTITMNSDGWRVNEEDGSFVALCANQADAIVVASVSFTAVRFGPREGDRLPSSTPPAASHDTRERAYKALYAYATCEEAAWHTDHEAGDAILETHGWKRGEASHQFLADLRRKALSAALDANKE